MITGSPYRPQEAVGRRSPHSCARPPQPAKPPVEARPSEVEALTRPGGWGHVEVQSGDGSKVPQVGADQQDYQVQIELATLLLLRSVRGLTDDEVHGASLLPGWTRAHVLTHVARSADAMVNLLQWARTGTPMAAYASQSVRDDAIDAGAGRGVAALLADLPASAERFRRETVALPERAWQRGVRVLDGAEFPAAELLDRRLVEVELHHTDLDVGYTPRDWPAQSAEMPLAEPMRRQREDRLVDRRSR